MFTSIFIEVCARLSTSVLWDLADISALYCTHLSFQFIHCKILLFIKSYMSVILLFFFMQRENSKSISSGFQGKSTCFKSFLKSGFFVSSFYLIHRSNIPHSFLFQDADSHFSKVLETIKIISFGNWLKYSYWYAVNDVIGVDLPLRILSSILNNSIQFKGALLTWKFPKQCCQSIKIN